MEILVRITIFVVSGVTFLRNIGNFPLRNWDEVWYAEIIKNMASGQYGFLVPFWNGEYYFDKPPLYFWLSVPFFKIFGPGEWQARIISATSAILATFLVYLIGRRLFGNRVAVLAVAIFLTLGQVVIRLAHGNLDALLVFLILATVYFYLLAWRLWIIGGVLALTYLAKGWILGLLPILTLLLFEYLMLGKNFKRVLVVVGVSILLVLPYFILGFVTFGREFVNSYLLNPTASLFSLSAFSLEFLANLVRDAGFWLVPLVVGFSVALRLKGGDRPKLLVLAATSLLFLLTISLLSGKLGWYALPVYPFISILAAYFIERIFAKKPVLAGILVAVVVLLQIYNVNRIENIYPDRSRVGATLGKAAREMVPQEDLLILDNRDLPAFLFYSDHKQVLVVSGGDSRAWERWIYRYEDLPKLFTGKTAWIVTRNQDLVAEGQVLTEVEGYRFLKVP